MTLANRLSMSLVVSTAAISSAAHATPPAAITVTNVSTIYTPPDAPQTTYNYSDFAPTATVSHVIPGSSATATTNASTRTVSVSAHSTEPPDGGEGETEANADLTYYYDAVGTTKPVPIDISYYLTASRTLPPGRNDSPLSEARILFSQNLTDGTNVYDDQAFAEAGGGGPDNDSQTVAATFSTEFLPDEAYGEIDLQTTGSSFGLAGFSSSSYALADPYIYIDPGFLAANPGVTLEISPGVGNGGPVAPGVPEPGTWLLSLLGFGWVGLILRRRRPAASPAILPS